MTTISPDESVEAPVGFEVIPSVDDEEKSSTPVRNNEEPEAPVSFDQSPGYKAFWISNIVTRTPSKEQVNAHRENITKIPSPKTNSSDDFQKSDADIVLTAADITPWVSDSPKQNKTVMFECDDGSLENSGTANHSDNINFLEDSLDEMTYGRKIALSLTKEKWYNPNNLDSEEDETGLLHNGNSKCSQYSSYVKKPLNTIGRGRVKREEPVPSLRKGWAYFEHVTLPRFVIGDEKSKNLERAEPGECSRKTKLYSPLSTPLSQMGDFGFGVGLYFSTLAGLVVICFVAGLINIPNIIYFAGKEYSNSQPGLPFLMKGSAVCTQERWVPCPGCKPELFFNTSRFYSTEEMNYALKNDCDGATFKAGMINLSTAVYFILCMYLLKLYVNHMQVKFDEDEQTAADYSIAIQNPPQDVNDPEAYKRFFENLGEDIKVNCVTLSRNNDVLVRALVERREILERFTDLLAPGTPLDENNLAKISAKCVKERTILQKLFAVTLHPLGIALDMAALHNKLIVLSSEIRGLSQLDYDVTKVFITFETERAQREILSKMSVGTLDVFRQKSNRFSEEEDQKYLFGDDKIVLDVYEPEEPSSIRWEDLNSSMFSRLKYLCITTYFSWLIIVGVAYVIADLRARSTTYAAIGISIANTLFPRLGKSITNLESHPNESSKEASLYLKIAVFRWVNTAIITTIISPFTDTLSSDDGSLISGISKIFIAEIITTNVIQLGDPYGNWSRHYLAPRASSQQKTDLCFTGTEFYLSERYTNMTKILFLAFFYCAVYPGALFLAAISLFVNYYTDRFSIMKTWKPAPQIGSHMSRLSQKFFFSTSLIALVVASSYYWSGFPFDNLCENADVDTGLEKDLSSVIIESNGDTLEFDFQKGDPTYSFCNQDLLKPESDVYFPAIPYWVDVIGKGDWMTKEQKKLTQIYGWFSVTVFVLVFLKITFYFFLELKKVFFSSYKSIGKDMGIEFSKASSISAYIPQVRSSSFPYPLLACDVEGLDDYLFDWSDPHLEYSYYSLVNDANRILSDTEAKDHCSEHVFDSITYWNDDESNIRKILRQSMI